MAFNVFRRPVASPAESATVSDTPSPIEQSAEPNAEPAAAVGTAGKADGDNKSSTNNGNHSQLADYAVIAASAVIVLGGIHYAQALLAPIFLAAFFALLLSVPSRWLQNTFHISTGVCTLFLCFAVFVFGMGMITVIGSQLREFTKNASEYKRKIDDNIESLGQILAGFEDSSDQTEDGVTRKVTRYKIFRPVGYVATSDSPKSISEKNTAERIVEERSEESNSSAPLDSAGEDGNMADSSDFKATFIEGTSLPATEADSGEDNNEPPHFADGKSDVQSITGTSEDAAKFGFDSIFSALNDFLSPEVILQLAGKAFLVMIYVIFMLIEAPKLSEKSKAAFANRKNLTTDRVDGTIDMIKTYIKCKTAISIIVGVLVTILLVFFHVPYPLLWGVIAFLFNFIPNIGSVVAAIPPILIVFADQGLMPTLWVTIGLIAINCVMGYAVEPRWMGKGLGVSPLVVLLSLVVCGWLLGGVGCFLAPPLAVICCLICKTFNETDWIADLMVDPNAEKNKKNGKKDGKNPSDSQEIRSA